MLRRPEYSRALTGSLKSSSLLYTSSSPSASQSTNVTRITTSLRTFQKAAQAPNRSFSFSHYQTQHSSSGSNGSGSSSSSSSSSSAGSSSSSSLFMKLSLAAASVVSLYAASTYAVWSLQESNPSIYKTFDRHIPLGHYILEFLEERQYQEKMRTRKEFYDSQGSVQPYVSRTYKGAAGDEQDDHSSHSKATSSGKGGSSSVTHDPLSPERFFDAKSGTVGLGEREYLPLILLPDTNNPVVHEISMSLNVLISSVNASAVSDETVNNVSQLFHRLSEETKSEKHLQQDSKLFEEEAQVFTSLVDAFKQVRPKAGSTDESEARLYRQYAENYHKRLANEILRAENILIAHCNTINATIREPRPFSLQPPVKPSSTTSKINTTTTSSTSYAKPDFALPTTDILELQISFNLLVSALHDHTNLPLSPYIQGIKSAIAASNHSNKEELIHRALQGVRIPDDVDIKPIIQDVLSDYK
ncbi:hypothetical protein AWJ20_4132 [Sugiyamaella lignohabitans]|uniref:Mitofilin n=1 Tax=Sugiyamaella lignohabitans TaxID=796027 RepID=A0A161HJ33_9ASCO|nr:uncharacterized protein AWJ20_4132 [Sugiyamaella lignohabitans]ANB11328.1 hypothetical protein AWJ20_4132 [Sugiyamaella lignohabitans]